MLVVCTSNRPRELRDEGSLAGCALEPSRLFSHTCLRQPQHELKLLPQPIPHNHLIQHLHPCLPIYPPYPTFSYSSFLMSLCPYMIDKYCCCLLPAFRYELDSLRGSI